MDLKIIKPVEKYLKEFESPEEFNVFYAKNKDEIDSQTTHKLNKQYHIKGYVITKIKGELCLKKPWIKKNNNQSSDLDFTSFSACKAEMSSQMESLESRVKRLEETVNKIIDLLQSN